MQLRWPIMLAWAVVSLSACDPNMLNSSGYGTPGYSSPSYGSPSYPPPPRDYYPNRYDDRSRYNYDRDYYDERRREELEEERRKLERERRDMQREERELQRERERERERSRDARPEPTPAAEPQVIRPSCPSGTSFDGKHCIIPSDQRRKGGKGTTSACPRGMWVSGDRCVGG